MAFILTRSTTPLKSSHPASEWLKKHGDGVRDVAFEVDDAHLAYKSCMERGAISNSEPQDNHDDGFF